MHSIARHRFLAAIALCFLLFGCAEPDPGGGEQIQAFAGGMDWEDGFVPIYRDSVEGKVYLLLGDQPQELLYQGSLPRGVGSNDIGLDRGQLGQPAALVRFEPVGDRVLLKQLNTQYRADSKSAAERAAVEQAFATSVLWGFPVVARDPGHLLVDATGFLLRDSHGIGPHLADLGEGNFSVDVARSAAFMARTRAFPLNTELEALVTFTGSNPGPELTSVAPDPFSLSVHMHHSFIELPAPGYEPREFHPESGYFDVTYADYAAAIGDPLEKRLIPRHRLSSDSGNANQLIYYVDPGTPEPIRSALIEGASWWSDAFAAAGFDDAFKVEMLPDDADPMDVRFNVIQWVHRSTRGWSYGASVVDPRTGEILKGHVTLGSLRVRQDLLLARGMTSPFGDEEADSKEQEMALARIRQLSAHEVGHTLGLAHNFAASGRNRESVMDYPYPKILLNDSGAPSLDEAYASGIGEWDRRAIIYGYAEVDGESDNEAALLGQIIADNKRSGFEFISDPDSRGIEDFHPRSHLWDNGADSIAELNRLMDLRQKSLQAFGQRSLPANAALSDLQEAIVPVYLFHRYQIEAVGKLIGGADYGYTLNDAQPAPAVEPVAPSRQREALTALINTVSPEHLTLSQDLLKLIPPKAYGYIRSRESAPARTGALFDPITLAEAAARHTLSSILHPERLARVALQASYDDTQLSLDEMFMQLRKDLLLKEYSGVDGAIHRRVAGLLLDKWRALYGNAAAAPEVRAVSAAALERSLRDLKARYRSKPAYRDFYQYENRLTTLALQGQGGVKPSKAAAVPPGSPIGSTQ